MCKNCPICYTDINSKDELITTCKHTFHKKCIKKWIASGINNTCPLCRSKMVYVKWKSWKICGRYFIIYDFS